MNDLTTKEQHWPGLIVGSFMALIPSFDRFSELGDPSHWPLQLGWSLFAISLSVYSFAKFKQKIVIPNLLLVWSALALWSFLGYFIVDISALSEWKLASFRYLGYTAFLFLGSNFKNEKGSVHPFIANTIVGFGAMISIYYLVDFSTTNSALTEPYGVTGLMGHKNFNASAIAITIPITVLMVYKSQKNKGLYLFILFLGIISIILSQTRSIFLASLISVIITTLSGWRPRKKVWLASAGIVFIAIAILSQPKIQNRLLDPTNLRIRGIFWGHSLDMLESSPVNGICSGQWRIAFPKYGLEGTNPSVAEGITSEVRPHNDFLWILSENGIIGFSLFSFFFILLWISWFKRIRENKSIDQYSSGAVLVIVTIYSFFEFPLERMAIYGPFMLIAGFIISEEVKSINFVTKKFIYPIIILFLLCLSYASSKAIEGDRQNQIVLKKNSNRDAQNIGKTVNKAINSWNELDRYGNPLIYFSGMGSMFGEAQKSNTGKFGPRDFIKAEIFFMEALEIHPNHVVTLFQLGNLYSYRGELNKAENIYQKLLKISPRHPGGQIAYANNLLRLDKPEESARVLISAFLNPDQYQSENYVNTVIKSLRKCPKNTSHKGLKKTIKNRENLNDQELFNQFQTFKTKKKKERKNYLISK
ncbi:MAG: O-antigen ligase family protein [Schleiferiaceae bacterium]|nr:O-antigen ligase family protein [Schleiferiaceae bacterium]